jgi:hypothetical protein
MAIFDVYWILLGVREWGIWLNAMLSAYVFKSTFMYHLKNPVLIHW